MAEGLAIGSGFAQGLTKVLLGKRQKDTEESFQRENRNVNIKLALLPEIIKRAESYADVEPFINELLGDTKGKKGAKGDPDVHGLLSQVLTPAFGASKDPMAAVRQDANTVNAAVDAKLPPRQTMFGVPILSDDEVAQRDTDRLVAGTKAVEGAKLDAQTEAKLGQAARLRQIDPEMTVQESLIAVGLKVPQDKFAVIPSGGGVMNTVTGEVKEPPSAKTVNLPAQLRERVEELRSLNPGMDEAGLRAEAAKQLQAERLLEDETKEANAASIQASRDSINANRAIQNTLLKMQQDAGGITPNNAAALTTQLRRDWTKAVEPFKARDTYVAKLQETVTPGSDGKTMIQRDRNAATQTIINSFNRLLEEGNVVREGEYARSETLAPLATWLEAKITALTAGGGRLTDAQLESLAKEGIRIASVTKSVFEGGLRDQRLAMENQLKRYNIPSQDVFGNSNIGAAVQTITINGKPFTGTQAQIDAYKRRYPNAQ